jgi:phosphonate transport system substrate-binding protein
MKKNILLLIAIMLISSSFIVNAQEYTFGIVPQQSSKKLARLWGPVLKKLSEDTGLTIKFATAKDIPTFEKRLAAGEYDFSYMNPYHFTIFNRAPGYAALARQRNKKNKGIIVVKKDSELRELEDLKGMTLAFPSPAAFAATLLSQAELNRKGIEFTPKYVSSHDSVYLSVARGLLPAGGGIVRTFKNIDPAIREQLRIFWTSDGFTSHAFAAHPNVSVDNRELVADALAKLESTDTGLDLLKSLNFKGMQSAEDKDWDDVRNLQITALEK